MGASRWLPGLQWSPTSGTQQASRAAELLQAAANGDLRATEALAPGDDSRTAWVARVRLRLSQVVAEVRSQAVIVAEEGDKLSQRTDALAQKTERDAAALQQTSASLQELNEGIQRTAANSAQVDAHVRGIRQVTSVATAESAQAQDVMQTINQRAQVVAAALKVIEDISRQTNILAINSAIEAARAGEAGRSFAVVAQEIRELARKSAAAATEVRQATERSAEAVVVGLKGVARLKGSLTDIDQAIDELGGAAAAMAADTREQSLAVAQIAEAVNHIDESTQRAAGVVTQLSQSAENLADRAVRIGQAVGSMRLHQGTADEALAMVQKAQQHIAAVGLEVALRDFHQPAGGFIDRDLFIVIFDSSGTYVAQGAKPEFRGRRLHDMPGVDAENLLQQASRAAQAGGGWIEYSVLNPSSGAVQDKVSFFDQCGDGLLIGCGVFRTVSQALK